MRLGEWEICRSIDCIRAEPVILFGDPLEARRWLQFLTFDPSQLQRLRSLLDSEPRAVSPGQVTDRVAIDRIVELLISRRYHVHHLAVPIVVARQGDDDGASGAKPVTSQANNSSSQTAPAANDPATFPANLNGSKQAATLIAAASTGAALVALCTPS